MDCINFLTLIFVLISSEKKLVRMQLKLKMEGILHNFKYSICCSTESCRTSYRNLFSSNVEYPCYLKNWYASTLKS